MAKNRTCLCCGKEYQYCPNCQNAKDYPVWKAEFDEMGCKEIFNIVSAYNMKIATAEDVKAVIKKYDITDFNKYKKSIKDKLIEVSKIPSEKEEIKEEPKVEKTEEVKPQIKMENKFEKKKFGNK